MNTQQAVDNLSRQLPLLQRQQQLDPELQALHKGILFSFIQQGRPLANDEIANRLQQHSVEDALQRLADDDLIVVDAAHKKVLGAYPMTVEQTAHKIEVNGHSFFAMCALDAVSIAPMFETEVTISSQCAWSGEAVSIQMRGKQLLSVAPPAEIKVGILWQMPGSVAAHSMCMEMVFLLNEEAAQQWQQQKHAQVSIFSLQDAVEFGAAFFTPLLDGSTGQQQ